MKREPTPAPPPRLPTDSTDVAWVAVSVSQSPAELAALLADVELLFRLNPYYTFDSWQRTGSNSVRAGFENHSNDQRVDVEFDVTAGPGDGITIGYRQGLKRRTHFSIETLDRNRRLVITDDYGGLPEDQRAARLAEVDKSLPAWGEALRVYCLRQARWSWLPGWKWYLRRVWVPMKPSQRRIVWLVWLITVAEFGFFLFVLLIYLIEHRA